VHAQLSQYFEARMAAEQQQTLAVAAVAASRAVELERAETQLEAVRRLTGPSVGFQVASVILAGIGGWLLSTTIPVGVIVLLVAGACYGLGTWMQKRAIPPRGQR
jgi:outer membrane lipoprotein SlyB